MSTVNLGCKLDLKKIALHARNAEYNPKRFAAVIMRIRDPRTTALIFSSGKMVCTGAKRYLLVRIFYQVVERSLITNHDQFFHIMHHNKILDLCDGTYHHINLTIIIKQILTLFGVPNYESQT